MLRNSGVRAFTLIELLTVMVIILILAALVLALVGYGQNKAARSKAEGEIAAISTALESYKIDNGNYPRVLLTNSSTTAPTGESDCDKLNARTDTDPGASGAGGSYKDAGTILYRALTGDVDGRGPNSTTAYSKSYYNVPPSELPSTPATNGEYIVDPFGEPYGYSTAYQYDIEQTPNTVPARGYNPTFDLWSSAGYGTGGKGYPTPTPSDKSILWIKNW